MKARTQQKTGTYIYRFLLIGVGIVFIAVLYASCGAASGEAVKSESGTAVNEDSVRMYQVDLDFNFAYQNYTQKNFKQATPYYWNAIKNDKELRYNMFRQLGQCYIELEEPDSAQMVYEMGVNKTPDDIYIREKLEWIYEAKMDFEKAIEQTQKILELSGDDAKKQKYYLVKLKDLYLRSDQIENAIGIFDKLIVLEPDNKELQDQKMSLIQLKGGSVIDEYKELHKKYPNDKKYIEALLAEYHKENDDINILIMVDKLLAIEPDNISALDKKADAFENQQKWNDRIDILKKIMQLKGGSDPETLCDISDCYLALKRYSTARSFALKAARQDYGMAYIRIGEAYEYCAEDVISKRGRKIRFDDKLIYGLAYQQYKKASNYPDVAGIAQRRMRVVQNYMPTKEDRFMNPDKKKATSKEYQWIY
ncbi:tetratricopeptide repeat protein [candidate division KSB1 bacterium]